MRLIDADALIENCKKYLNALNPDREVKEFARIYWLIGVLENAPTIEPESCGDAVSRKEVLTIVEELQARAGKLDEGLIRSAVEATLKPIREITNRLPAAQPERDIPIKPVEATDTAWGIPNRQAVCPKCDCYLGHVEFLGDYKGKKVTYCEKCGQAIDWEGWDFE